MSFTKTMGMRRVVITGVGMVTSIGARCAHRVEAAAGR